MRVARLLIELVADWKAKRSKARPPGGELTGTGRRHNPRRVRLKLLRPRRLSFDGYSNYMRPAAHHAPLLNASTPKTSLVPAPHGGELTRECMRSGVENGLGLPSMATQSAAT